MPASLDCIICLTRQSLEAARFATNDEKRQAATLRRVLQFVEDKGFTTIPPLVAQGIQRIVREETGNDDPYGEAKRRFNALMLSARDALRRRIRSSSDPMKTAIRLAIAGNAIDFAVRGDWTEALVVEAVETALNQSVNGNIEELVDAVSAARQVLYVLDNCGEIVCDQLLIEEIKRFRPDLGVTASVRGAAVLNDATWTDARQIGLEETVDVIDNGNDGVGTVLEQCGDRFRATLDRSDLIIAKGLANFETLTEYDRDVLPQRVCFLFKAKCAFISRFAGVRLNDLVLRMREGRPADGEAGRPPETR